MALIEVFHVVATHYPIDTANVPTIFEGMVVTLNTGGNVVLHTGTAGVMIAGIAGDSTTLSTAANLATPYSDAITVNAGGATVQTQNRVSDPSGDETLASGRLTVYNGGGEFHTDQFETLDGTTIIDYEPSNALHASTNGRLTENTTSPQLGWTVVAPRAFPSGVPGTDTSDGSLSLGTFITFKLALV